jgi:membrane protein
VGFSYFVANFGQYNELYGSIGALIVTLLWFNLICFVLLVGFEINASIAVNRDLLMNSNKDNTEEETLLKSGDSAS